MFRLVLAFVLLALPVSSQTKYDTQTGPVTITTIATGLDEPWAVAFLPDNAVLITERDGRLLLGKNGSLSRVKNVPKVLAQGQGGLLDVVAARDFATSSQIFLTYSEPRRGGSGTALAIATLDVEAGALSNLSVIFRQKHAYGQAKHFGSRAVEAPDGSIFVTIGDRGEPDMAQDLMRHSGKVIRVNRDGSIPADNPFAGGGGLPEIWSYGHRNAQGATLDGAGRLWTVEHGARGGDEINAPSAGSNYGWPVISYGRHYSGGKIGVGTARDGMEQPAFYWDPSIAPSGMMIYSGKLFPQYRGDIFVGSLKFNMISRLSVGSGVTEVERLFEDKFTRIRDVREAPDGAIWFLSVVDGALYRMTPG